MDNTAQVLREHGVKIRTEATILELGTIEASTEKVIEGEHDDRAMTIVIGLATLKWKMKNGRGGMFTNIKLPLPHQVGCGWLQRPLFSLCKCYPECP